MAEPIRTTCPYCGTGCGVLAEKSEAGWTVRGDPDHPANFGRLCSKGAALGDTLGLETRLLHPLIGGQRVSWGEAIGAVAEGLAATIAAEGPGAVALYLSGQLLTEDYYAANKLAKGFLGTANVDTNSRLCMASAVAGHRRAFGADTVPGCYADLEEADLVVIVGSNLAWCHPVLFQRLAAAREARGTRVVVIDPRRTETCDLADLHLALAPGSDVALFNGLLAYLGASDAIDRGFVEGWTTGYAESVAAAWADAPSAAAVTGIPAADLVRFYEWFAATPKTVTLFSQGVNQSSAGTDKVNAILNAHLATGRIGRPGMGPFSLTGQPNAMGGREVGGLANQLAAHMDFAPGNCDRLRRFWNAPAVAEAEGLKAVDLFQAIGAGKVEAVWIMGTNPAVSLPEADAVRKALARCPLVIASDCVADTDTMRLAHIRLPALGWGEKSGTVTNSERTISRQRPFLPPPGEARADWWMVAEVAKAMGFEAGFAWEGPGGIFREHARLSAFENEGRRDFDIGAAADADYDALTPFQWGERRMFADGGFFTPDGRARLIPVRHRPPVAVRSAHYPFRLNTGRYRDQWHTMTRTGLSARLSGHRREPLIEIHPSDAAEAGLADGALVRVESRHGGYVGRLHATPAQRRGDLFLPMHWNDCFAASALAGRLLSAHTDPISGQPESKHEAVRVTAFAPVFEGVLIAGAGLALPGIPWWVRHKTAGAEAVELAGDREEQAAALLAALDGHFGTPLTFRDPARGVARFAWMEGERLRAVLFLASDGRPEPARSWLAGFIGQELAAPLERAQILAGLAPAGAPGAGPILCACFSVAAATIAQAIAEGKLTSVAAIGAALKAGTGCGSCIPEIRGMLKVSA